MSDLNSVGVDQHKLDIKMQEESVESVAKTNPTPMNRDLPASVGANYNVPVMFIIQYMIRIQYYMNRYAHVPILADVIKKYELTDAEAAAIQSYMYIPYVTLIFTAGDISDRYSRKGIVCIGMILDIIGLLACAYSNIYSIFLAGRILTMFTQTFQSVCLSTLISDMFYGELRTKMSGIYYAAVPVGLILANIIPAIIFKFFETIGSVFIVLAIMQSTLFVLFYTLHPSLPPGWSYMRATGKVPFKGNPNDNGDLHANEVDGGKLPSVSKGRSFFKDLQYLISKKGWVFCVLGYVFSSGILEYTITWLQEFIRRGHVIDRTNDIQPCILDTFDDYLEKRTQKN